MPRLHGLRRFYRLHDILLQTRRTRQFSTKKLSPLFDRISLFFPDMFLVCSLSKVLRKWTPLFFNKLSYSDTPRPISNCDHGEIVLPCLVVIRFGDHNSTLWSPFWHSQDSVCHTRLPELFQSASTLKPVVKHYILCETTFVRQKQAWRLREYSI